MSMTPARCFRSFLILAFVLARPVLAADPPQPAPFSKLQPCKIDGVEGEARCGTYAVWEDRAAKKGRKIDLYVVVLPALGPERAPDPVVFLSGGPGEGAASIAVWLAKEVTDLRKRRDLVLVDQRGTGRSNPLPCDLYSNATVQEIADHLLPPQGVRRCRAELEKKADLRFYNTSLAMDDLDEVLAWLGYEKVNLVAGSYGTKAAQVYLRHHSGRVRAAVLSGVDPVDDPAPLLYARAGQRAVDLLLADCAADQVCRTAFPKVREELRAVMERIDQGVKVSVKDPRDGKTYEVRPNRGLVAEGIRYLLYSDMARYVPYLVHRAFQGDLAPLVSASLARRAGIVQAIAVGMFLSVTCSEEVPFIDPGVVGKETEGTLLRDFRVREQKRACELWPRGSVPAEDRELVRTEVPVLLISGERDPVTPPDFGERVASRLPNALHVVMPRGAHSTGPCGQSLTTAFIERGSAQGLDLSCVKAPPPAAFATEPPADMPSQSQVEAFRYQPDKVPVGKVYHYVKTNIDGTHPEQVSLWVAAPDRIESFKFHPGETPAALVIAVMDWSTFSVDSIESWQLLEKGERKLAATLRTESGGKMVNVDVPMLGRPAVKVEIGRLPWHVYNFDLASLNFAFRHLVDPKGKFVIGIADPNFRDEGPVFLYRGEAEVAYVGEEERAGVPCRKYRIDGPGLENRGGFLWVSRDEGHVEDIEIDLPDNPAWKTFKFRLKKTETMDRAAWERFQKEQIQSPEPAGSPR